MRVDVGWAAGDARALAIRIATHALGHHPEVRVVPATA
jgi:hypothetical protein